MSSDEEIFEAYRKKLIEEEREKIKEHKSEIEFFIDFCDQKGLYLSQDDFKYIQTIGIIVQSKGILAKIQPALIRDKEGLVSWSKANDLYTIKEFNEGYLYADNYMAMASSLFRRGFHSLNNWAPRFVDLFWSLDKSNIEAFIALDFDRVRINVNDLCYAEADTWYGAPYHNNISEIKDSVVKLVPPPQLNSRYVELFFRSAYALDIEWYTHSNIKTFQALEFKTEGITIHKNGHEYHPVRYVHAEYNLDTNHFRHFDGAIQYLTSDEYYARRDTDFNHNRKAGVHLKPMSEKLFKFNGNINIEMWKEFTSHFFTGNPLIYEYFSGKYPDYVKDMLRRVIDNEAA